MKRALLGAALLIAAAWDDHRGERCGWEQWGQSAAHDGAVCAVAQSPDRVLAQLTFDPFVAEEIAAFGGLPTHYHSRGHLIKFDHRGTFRGTFNFGWDSTPAIYRHDGTYSIVLKDNHYRDGPFFITQLDKDLVPEWQFQNTETRRCARQPDGTIACTDDGQHADGFEWCINAPALDRDGNVMALSEDGNLYIIGQGGVLRSKTFLTLSVGASYTPAAIDPRGRVYAENGGDLRVLGF